MSSSKDDAELEAALLVLAKPVVMGVVTARANDNIADAHLMLTTYQMDAYALGSTSGRAWAMLFSAATLWTAGLIELHAAEHSKPVLDSLQELALAYAAGADVNG